MPVQSLQLIEIQNKKATFWLSAQIAHHKVKSYAINRENFMIYYAEHGPRLIVMLLLVMTDQDDR
jgi:hypothetical protein